MLCRMSTVVEGRCTNGPKLTEGRAFYRSLLRVNILISYFHATSVAELLLLLALPAACFINSFSVSPLVSPNTSSISSSVLPLVSGTKKYAQTAASAQKAAKKIYVPKPAESSIGGVATPTIKFDIHTVAVLRATPFALVALENTSDGSAHASGE